MLVSCVLYYKLVELQHVSRFGPWNVSSAMVSTAGRGELE